MSEDNIEEEDLYGSDNEDINNQQDNQEGEV